MNRRHFLIRGISIISICIALLSVNNKAKDVIVLWDKVKDAQEYSIQYGTEDVVSVHIITENKFIITDVVEGRQYFIKVKSINKSGSSSKYSPVLKFRLASTNDVVDLKAPSPRLVLP